MNCEECQGHLFALVDNELTGDARRDVDQHVETCPVCQEALADIWSMQMAASRWRDQTPPRWDKRTFFFGSSLPGFFGMGLQLASTFASVAVLVLVMTEARISTSDGFTVRFGGSDEYVQKEALNTQLAELKQVQNQSLESSVARLTDQQITTNQLLLRTVLDQSREERREDLQNLVVLLEESQDDWTSTTEEQLRYLIASQLRDREEIEQLSSALLQVDTNRNY